MNKEIEDSTWNAEAIEILDRFEGNRNVVLRATRQLLLDFYNQNFQCNERVLEVGSGTGFLRRNLPEEFQGEWIQLDSQIAFLEEAERRFPEGTYVHGSAYDLPFPDGSLDVVCGYGSFDVLFDLDSAVKEASRVLKEGGLFFHLLDLYPSHTPIITELDSRKLPLETKTHHSFNGHSQIESISFVPEERLEEFHKANAALKAYFGSKKFHKKESRIWKKHAQEVQTHAYFGGKLVQILSFYFDNGAIESGEIKARFKGKKTEQQRERYKDYSVYLDDAGRHTPYGNSTIYNMFQLNFPAMLNILPLYHDAFYMHLRKIFPSLAEKIEPKVIEISTIKYAKARK